MVCVVLLGGARTVGVAISEPGVGVASCVSCVSASVSLTCTAGPDSTASTLKPVKLSSDSAAAGDEGTPPANAASEPTPCVPSPASAPCSSKELAVAGRQAVFVRLGLVALLLLLLLLTIAAAAGVDASVVAGESAAGWSTWREPALPLSRAVCGVAAVSVVCLLLLGSSSPSGAAAALPVLVVCEEDSAEAEDRSSLSIRPFAFLLLDARRRAAAVLLCCRSSCCCRFFS